MKRDLREKAQDAVVDYVVYGILSARERGDEELAKAMEILGTRLAKQYGLQDVPGLLTTCSGAA